MQDNDRLYVVPEGILFIWPFVEVSFCVRARSLPRARDVVCSLLSAILMFRAPVVSLSLLDFTQRGYRTVIPGKLLDMGEHESVVLESISDLPRIFRIHHFFNEQEADTLVRRVGAPQALGDSLRVRAPSDARSFRSRAVGVLITTDREHARHQRRAIQAQAIDDRSRNRSSQSPSLVRLCASVLAANSKQTQVTYSTTRTSENAFDTT